MSEPKKIKYESDAAGLTITKDPIYVKRMVGGQMETVQTTPPPLRFNNFELEVDADNEEDLKLLDNHRLNPSYFRRKEVDEIVPEKVAKKIKPDPDENDQDDEGPALEPEAEEKVVADEVPDTNNDGAITVEDATTIQHAKAYLIDKLGVDGRSIATPDKIQAEAKKLNVNFPNVNWG